MATLKHKTWLYTGTWSEDVIYMIVEFKDSYVTFFHDGAHRTFRGKAYLDRLKGSWELVE